MFEVLVYVYENYWRGDACPELHQLERKLSAHGFEPDEIHDALVWLDGLNNAAQNILLPAESQAEWAPQPSDASMRVFSVNEQDHLGAECLGFLSFLEGSGVLPPALREIVVDRAELEDARWFDKDEIVSMLQRRHPQGLTTPPPVAIAHHIIRTWLDGEIGFA